MKSSYRTFLPDLANFVRILNGLGAAPFDSSLVISGDWDDRATRQTAPFGERSRRLRGIAHVACTLAPMDAFPKEFLHKLLFIRIGKGDAEQVEEVLAWGADPNWKSPGGRPAIVRAVRGICISADVVRVLLEAGADPRERDQLGETALERVRKRLARYADRPRKKHRRSRSLTPGGELILPKREWDFIESMESEHPGFEDEYLKSRRKAAESVCDPRAQLEVALALLDADNR